VRTAGRPSWQVIVEHPQVLAIALYIRDVAGLPHEAPPADLPGLVPPVAPDGATSASNEATAEWNAWWSRALSSGPRAEMELQPPDFPAFTDAPALRQLLQRHFEAARRWSDDGTRAHADHMMRNPLPIGEVVADVERGLARAAHPFTLRLDEVPVAGQGLWPVTHAHVLVSPLLLRNPDALFTELRPAVEKLA
jgi:hypothetical protein